MKEEKDQNEKKTIKSFDFSKLEEMFSKGISKEEEQAILEYLNPKKVLWGMALGCSFTGFLFGLAGVAFMERRNIKGSPIRVNAIGTAFSALAIGTALCGATAFVVTKATMWGLGVSNTKEFAKKMKELIGNENPTKEQK